MPIITCIWVLARLPVIQVGRIVLNILEMVSQEIYIKTEMLLKFRIIYKEGISTL